MYTDKNYRIKQRRVGAIPVVAAIKNWSLPCTATVTTQHIVLTSGEHNVYSPGLIPWEVDTI